MATRIYHVDESLLISFVEPRIFFVPACGDLFSFPPFPVDFAQKNGKKVGACDMTVISHLGFALTIPHLFTSMLDSVLLPQSISQGENVKTESTTGVLRLISSRVEKNIDSRIDGKNKNKENEHINTSANFVSRYDGPNVDDMTTQQLKIRDSILASRSGTGLNGPFGPWLAIPDIAGPAQELGRACRYGTSLDPRESELVILLTAAKTRSATEFDLHVGEALKAGLTMKLIQSIPRDDEFSTVAVQKKVLPLLRLPDDDRATANENEIKRHERQVAIATYTAELLDTYTVSDETYYSTKDALDDKDSVLVEITSIVGYYTYVSYTLNAFQIPSSKTQG